MNTVEPFINASIVSFCNLAFSGIYHIHISTTELANHTNPKLAHIQRTEQASSLSFWAVHMRQCRLRQRPAELGPSTVQRRLLYAAYRVLRCYVGIYNGASLEETKEIVVVGEAK
jgi:hypothetical protein